MLDHVAALKCVIINVFNETRTHNIFLLSCHDMHMVLHRPVFKPPCGCFSQGNTSSTMPREKRHRMPEVVGRTCSLTGLCSCHSGDGARYTQNLKAVFHLSSWPRITYTPSIRIHGKLMPGKCPSTPIPCQGSQILGGTQRHGSWRRQMQRRRALGRFPRWARQNPEFPYSPVCVP